MIETISRKVAPSQEQSTINLMTSFGWRVKSSQEINSTDSHLETRNDTLYSVTTKENYVKLLFDRDTEMKNYARLVQLEKQYAAIANAQPKFSLEVLMNKKLLFLLIPVLGIFLALPTIIEIVKKLFNDKKEWAQEFQVKANAIISEARSLL